MKVPCKDCENREVGCHSKCEEYIEWKEELAELNKKIAKEKLADWQANRRTHEAIKRMRNLRK